MSKVYYVENTFGATKSADLGNNIKTQSLAIKWMNEQKPFGNFVKDTILICNSSLLVKNGKDSNLVQIGDFKQRQIICPFKDMMKILVDKLGILVSFKEEPVMVITDITTEEVLLGEAKKKEVVETEVEKAPEVKSTAVISDRRSSFNHTTADLPQAETTLVQGWLATQVKETSGNVKAVEEVSHTLPVPNNTVATPTTATLSTYTQDNTAVLFIKSLRNDTLADINKIEDEIAKYTEEINRLEKLIDRLTDKQEIAYNTLKRIEDGLKEIESERALLTCANSTEAY